MDEVPDASGDEKEVFGFLHEALRPLAHRYILVRSRSTLLATALAVAGNYQGLAQQAICSCRELVCVGASKKLLPMFWAL